MMPLYAHVNQEACIACGLCQMLAPDLFHYNSEGIASYTPDHNTGSQPLNPTQAEAFTVAFKRCPTGAIEHRDAPFTD